MQPLANLKSTQYMQDKMEFSPSAMLTQSVKKKWQLKMFSAKIPC